MISLCQDGYMYTQHYALISTFAVVIAVNILFITVSMLNKTFKKEEYIVTQRFEEYGKFLVWLRSFEIYTQINCMIEALDAINLKKKLEKS